MHKQKNVFGLALLAVTLMGAVGAPRGAYADWRGTVALSNGGELEVMLDNEQQVDNGNLINITLKYQGLEYTAPVLVTHVAVNGDNLIIFAKDQNQQPMELRLTYETPLPDAMLKYVPPPVQPGAQQAQPQAQTGSPKQTAPKAAP